MPAPQDTRTLTELFNDTPTRTLAELLNTFDTPQFAIRCEQMRRLNPVMDGDLDTVRQFLTGIIQVKDGDPNVRVLSDGDEKAARIALSRILLSGNVDAWLLYLLAVLFTPELEIDPYLKGIVRKKILFKQRTKNLPNARRNFGIASLVYALRYLGGSYNEAVDVAVKVFGIDDSEVRKKYGMFKQKFEPLPKRPRRRISIRSR